VTDVETGARALSLAVVASQPQHKAADDAVIGLTNDIDVFVEARIVDQSQLADFSR